jgi:hypothetical protein
MTAKFNRLAGSPCAAWPRPPGALAGNSLSHPGGLTPCAERTTITQGQAKPIRPVGNRCHTLSAPIPCSDRVQTHADVAVVTRASRVYFAAFAFCLALNDAQRFLAASPIRFRAAALIFRLGFAGAALACLTAAHRFFCAAAIFRRAAWLMPRRLVGDVIPSAVLPILARSLAICWLISLRWCW